jgi:two-component system, LytTR family, response regulator
MPMNCIAIDDEPLALNIISEYCKKLAFANLTATYTNAVDAVAEIMKNKVDVMFLDVEMPGITGFEFINSLPEPPLLIFVSAHPEYAVDSFETNAVDFLLKPFSFDRFLKAINKAYVILNAKTKSPLLQESINDSSSVRNDKPGEYLFVKVDYSTTKVNYNEIKIIEGLKDYIKIYVNDKMLITKSTIKYMENKLPKDLFVRVHKSYIISINKIDKIEYNHIFIGQNKIPIGMQYKEAFYAKIDDFRL